MKTSCNVSYYPYKIYYAKFVIYTVKIKNIILLLRYLKYNNDTGIMEVIYETWKIKRSKC